jgi:hypothetical protein
MDATPNPSTTPERDAEVHALALVRRIRGDFATRTGGLAPDALIALIAREAEELIPAPTSTGSDRSVA